MILALFMACIPDDVADDSATKESTTDSQSGGDDSSSTDDSEPAGDQDITGAWLSEGDNISDLLAAGGFVKITANFKSDGTYTTDATDSRGTTYNLAGTYTVDTSTLPGTIVAHQTTPTSVTAEGIWQVNGDTLLYEVAQTSPDKGFTPPTPQGGFGSTTGPNVEPGINVQTYKRQ